LLNEIAVTSEKILIHGDVTEFFGQVTTIVPNETACLACIFPDYDVNSYIAGGVISPSVTTIASIQSFEAVKILLGFGETLKNRILVFDGLKMKFKKLKISKNLNCKIC
jgi:adenylyltransferase/sulfurtransferase